MPSHSNVGHRGQCLRIKNFSDFDSVKNWNYASPRIGTMPPQELELYPNCDSIRVKVSVLISNQNPDNKKPQLTSGSLSGS